MKTQRFLLVLIFLMSVSAKAQTELDTLVDTGRHKLHFHIIKGEGTPVLFESGMGNDATVWDGILQPVYKVTGTTLITYDRTGYGKSAADTTQADTVYNAAYGAEILETALKKLGYSGPLILVCHSYGGFYTWLYAHAHPEKVKYLIRLDASIASAYTNDVLKKFSSEKPDKSYGLGYYYERLNFPRSVKMMRTIPFPAGVPVTEVIAGTHDPDEAEEDVKRWNTCHMAFAAEQPNRKLLVAEGCHHYIMEDNPNLVIHLIIKACTETVDEKRRYEILQKALDNSIVLDNNNRKKTQDFLTSENNLNTIGYNLMAEGKLKEALEVFKLNVNLFPDKWNVYDSYAEALYMAKRNTEAIAMYKKSLLLNPDNENGRVMLKKLEAK